jgi:type II secretory pathway pseudopilin PulG
MTRINIKPGFTLFEVVLSFAVLMMVISTIFPTIGWMINRTKKLQNDTNAGLLMQEGMEAAYNVFLTNWGISEGVYHPAVSVVGMSEVWTLIPNEQTGVEAKFKRKIEVAHVCRSSSTGEHSLGVCGGDSVVDANSKWLKTTISWEEAGEPHKVESELLIANIGGT